MFLVSVRGFSGFFTLFALFNVIFLINCFIYGSRYKKADKETWQLLNLTVRVHVSRKHKIRGEPFADAVSVC